LEVLRRLGARAEGTDATGEALQTLREGSGRRFVLLDATLPGAARLIRHLRADEDVRVVLLTRAGLGRAAEREHGSGPRVPKPVCTLDLVRSMAAASGSPPEADAPDEEVPDASRPRRGRILLAEDNPVNRKLTMFVLAKDGHEVVVARDGREAVRAHERETFDLILMDIQMPHLNGLDATHEIRASERRRGRRTPIIAMTAHAMKGDREMCLQADMDGYVAKPIEPAALLRTIQEHLGDAPEEETGPEGDRAIRGIDVEALLRGLDGDEALLDELIGLFLEDLPGYRKSLGAAFVTGDADAVRRAAHGLKGAVANFAAECGDAVREVEEAARRGDLRKARRRWEDSERRLDGLAAALREVRAEL
jgi:two-component system sensor histidine kinase/response regulator